MSGTSPDHDGGASVPRMAYAYHLDVRGLAPADNQDLIDKLDGWIISSLPDRIMLTPLEDDTSGDSASEVLVDVLDLHADTLAMLSTVGTSRRISLGIYFDAIRVAAISPVIDAAVIKRLADIDFALEICIFPSSFDDEEEVEE